MKTPLPNRFSDEVAARHRQQGVAAIEFALLAIFMTTLLLGLMVWWQYFQANQILTRAAGDGARAAHTLVITGTAPCVVTNADANKASIETRVENIIKSQLTHSGLAAVNFSISNKLWKCSNTGTESFSFDVSYQLPPFIGSNSFLKEPTSLNIKDHIVVHFPSST